MQPNRSSLILSTLLLTLLFAAAPARAAVDLVSLDAYPEGAAVAIRWETATETDTVGFYIRRNLQREGEYERISPLIFTRGEFTTGASYEFLDPNVEPGVLYYYYLEVFNTDQSSDLEGPVWSGVGLPATPTASRVPTATRSPSPTRSPTATRRPTLTATSRPPTATSRPAGGGPVATWTIPPLPTSGPSATSAPPPTFRPTTLSTTPSGGTPQVQPSATRPPQPTATPSAAPGDEGGELPVVDQPPGEDAGELPVVEPPQTFPTTPVELGAGDEPPLPEATAELGLPELPTETPLGDELSGDLVNEPFEPTPTVFLSDAGAPSVEPASGAATTVAQAEQPAQAQEEDDVETVRAADGEAQQPEAASYADRMRQALLALIGLLLAYQVYRFYRSARQRAE